MKSMQSRKTDLPANDDVAADIRSKVPGGQTIVFVSGNFNVLHPGHVRLLRFARETGGFLVVAVHPDTATGVSVPEELRLEAVRSIETVDYAFILREDLISVILAIKPDVVVKGREHEIRDNPEQEIVRSYGGRLLFSSGDMRFSSLDLLERNYLEAATSTIRLPEDYPRRHGFTLADLVRLTKRFAELRVLVIGDLIVDDYVECDPLGLSQEDATVVVTPIGEHRFIGGAGIVAAHAAGLGAEVRLFTVAGDDDVAAYAEEKLQEYGVTSTVFRDHSRPTTLKQRYRAAGKTLLRVSHLRQHAIQQEIIERIVAGVEQDLPSADLLLFADFNYGCLPSKLIERLVESCKAHEVAMAADSQASSQLADISRFKDMKLITPTELEARLALKDRSSGLVFVGEQLQKASRAENIIITLGSEGLLIHAPKSGEVETDRLPALNTAPKDVAGAGDSLFTCAGLALCAGGDIWQSSLLGAIAAACQVSRVGNTPLSGDEIKAEICRFA